MPPKKDGKKDAKKGADLSPEERMALIEQTLEGEKNNLVCSTSPHISIMYIFPAPARCRGPVTPGRFSPIHYEHE